MSINDRDLVVAAAEAGAAVIRAHYGSPLARFAKEGDDFAAGIALCRAAGCVVTDLDGRPPHTGRGGLVAAADAATHAALLDLIARRRLNR